MAPDPRLFEIVVDHIPLGFLDRLFLARCGPGVELSSFRDVPGEGVKALSEKNPDDFHQPKVVALIKTGTSEPEAQFVVKRTKKEAFFGYDPVALRDWCAASVAECAPPRTCASGRGYIKGFVEPGLTLKEINCFDGRFRHLPVPAPGKFLFSILGYYVEVNVHSEAEELLDISYENGDIVAKCDPVSPDDIFEDTDDEPDQETGQDIGSLPRKT